MATTTRQKTTGKTKQERMYEALQRNTKRGLTIDQIRTRAGYKNANTVYSVLHRCNDIDSFRRPDGETRYKLTAAA